MLYAPQLPPSGNFNASNIAELQDYLNSLVPSGDNITTTVDWSGSGFIIKAIDSGDAVESDGGGGGTIYTIEIISGSNGAYNGDVIDPSTGEKTGDIVDVYATRTTGYDLTVGKNTVGFLSKTLTMA